jgi:beta-glucosidase
MFVSTMEKPEMKEDIQKIIANLSLEEKASLCSGRDFWYMKGVERLGIQAIMLTDGPHGLRKQAGKADHIGLNESVPATCFPTASATASSWNRELMVEIGRALGEECLQENVAVILGPGANIKRSPLCGRNFEYISEDPFLTGEMAAGLIEGVQSQGVGVSLKHFAVNNQESLRMTINAVVDERTLREIYLAGFEQAVKKASPWTVMSAYNKINGSYCSENKWLLTTLLREEWGHTGIVVTDWGANNDRVEGLKAGQDLEMPSSNGINDARIVEAVKSGALDEAVLDQSVARLLELILKADANRKGDFHYDAEAHHTLARRATAESIVLLKNEGGILPLKKDQKIALIGEFARQPRYQGAGSSLIVPQKLDNAHDELARLTDRFTFSAGYDLKSDVPDDALIQAACSAARDADVVVILAGLPARYETEGVDRESIQMPECHNELIRRVAEANPNTVVVLSNGAPVAMPWLSQVKGVLEAYLGGEAGGGGMVDVLYGAVNPAGKLAETFPLKTEDCPAHSYYPSGPKTVEYREGIYVGYRYYETAKKPVLFPFGHGLSYTTFTYSDLNIFKEWSAEAEDLQVNIIVKNAGPVAGAEVVQLYVRDVKSSIFRPDKELKGFARVFLQPGEEKSVEFTLNKRSFAYYNTSIHDWHIESGVFDILIGASCADIRARGAVWVESSQPEAQAPDLRKTASIYYHLSPPSGKLDIDDASFEALYGGELPPNQRLPGELFTINSTLGEIKGTFVGKRLYGMIKSSFQKMFGPTEDEATSKMMRHILEEMPLRNIVMMSNGQFSPAMVESLLQMMNGKFIPGLLKFFGVVMRKK